MKPVKLTTLFAVCFVVFGLAVFASESIARQVIETPVGEADTKPDSDTADDADHPIVNDGAIKSALSKLLESFAKPKPGDKDGDELPGTPVPALWGAYQVEGKPLRVGAVGVRKWDTDVKVKVTDLVHFGSCTKAMTAMMLGRLVDQGKLSFDTTVKEGLPHLLEDIHADYHDVTIRQLLNHRAGVPRDGFWHTKDGDTITEQRETIITTALMMESSTKNSAKMSYSNLGYAIAALIATQKEGVTWEELMKRELFDVLDMKSAGFGPPGTKGETDQPWGHYANGENLTPRQGDNPPSLGPAGTVHMSIEDWFKFAAQHAGYAENPILKPETLAVLQTPFPKTPPGNVRNEYSFGWIVTSRPWAGGDCLTHGGSNTMWMCTAWIAPKKKAVYFAVSNAGTGEHTARIVDRAISELVRIGVKSQ